MSIVSGFQKRAYNGSYAGGYGSIGQGGYDGYYQDSPANQSSLSKGVAAVGIGGTALYGAKKMRDAGAPMRQAKQNFAKAKKQYDAAKPGKLDRMIGGGALQEVQNRKTNAMNDTRSSGAAIKRYRAQGPGRIKTRAKAFVRGVKGKMKGTGLPGKNMAASTKAFSPKSFFKSIVHAGKKAL